MNEACETGRTTAELEANIEKFRAEAAAAEATCAEIEDSGKTDKNTISKLVEARAKRDLCRCRLDRLESELPAARFSELKAEYEAAHVAVREAMAAFTLVRQKTGGELRSYFTEAELFSGEIVDKSIPVTEAKRVVFACDGNEQHARHQLFLFTEKHPAFSGQV
jgi:hypothetical protein